MKPVAHPSLLPNPIRRISIIGTSGCGKSTLARTLAARTAVPHVELDALHWNDDWTESTDEQYRQRFDNATRDGRWILDGNYARAGMQDRAFADADLVLWLDLPLHTLMRRIIARSVRRAATKEPLWGTNNRESFRLLLASRHSMPLWVMRTFRSRRRKYETLFAQGAHDDTCIVRIRSARDVAPWLDAIAERAR